MEQQPGHINWTPTNPPVADGQVVRWCWQALYAGIDTLLFFRWQAARFGQEQYHSGLLRHDGTPDLGLHELRSFRAELERVRRDAPELLVRPPATVAVLSSYEDAWAIEIDPHRWGLDHRSLVTAAVAACCRLGLVADVVAPERDLSAYELILAPALHLATPVRLERLGGALDRGATVVLGPRSLVKDADDAWVAEPVPAGLAGRLGARLGVFTGELRGARLAPWGVEAGGWTEAFELDPLEPAAVLASYDGGGPALHGRPAAVRRGGLVALGAASADSWTALLGSLTGRNPAAAGTWVVERGGHRLEVDVTW
jgi:beta-galactosidase